MCQPDPTLKEKCLSPKVFLEDKFHRKPSGQIELHYAQASNLNTWITYVMCPKFTREHSPLARNEH